MCKASLVFDVVTYNAAYNAYELAQHLQQAPGTPVAKQKANLGPDIITYKSAIVACKRTRR